MTSEDSERHRLQHHQPCRSESPTTATLGAGADSASEAVGDDPGCLGNGGGLNVSATYLTATFGGAPAHYSLWLGQPCTSSVVVHLLFILDSSRSLKVSSDRICFTPENFSEPQLVRVDVMDHHSHSNAISHRIYSLDKNYDRISTPSVVIKTEWASVGSLLTFGGPMSKRKAAAVGSNLAVVELRRVIPTLPVLGASPGDSSGSSSGDGSADEQQLQDPLWFVCHMACGHNFSLAVATHQTSMLFSWGLNANGELGLGSATSNPEPQLVTALPMQMHGEVVSVLTVSCGKHHAALVTSQAKLFTWGNNKYGQLGHGDYTNRLEPQEVHFALATVSSNQRALRLRHMILERGGTNVTHAACGAFHTLFVTHQQNILAMGYNQAGQLGIGHRLQQHKSWRSCMPIAVEALRDRSILDVAAGQNHSACVLSNGAVYMWGCGDDGRLGVGRCDCEIRPTLVRSLQQSGVKVRNVRCGARHTAVLSDRDTLFVWGANEFGQLGCGDKKPRYKPCVLITPVLIAEGVEDIALGEFHSVCVTRSGRAYAWGLDLGGESTQIDQRSSPTPLLLPKGERVQRVSCGWSHTNLVTQSSSSSGASRISSCDDSVRGDDPHSASSKPRSEPPPTSRNFQRNIARKQLALREEEVARWKAFAAPWGFPVVERPPAVWRGAQTPRTLKSTSTTITLCPGMSTTDANEQHHSPRTAWRRRVATAFVEQVLDSVTRLCAERRARGHAIAANRCVSCLCSH